MATRNEVTTKKLKTGQRVTSPYKWAVVTSYGEWWFERTREDARLTALYHEGVNRIVRLNPITGVVSK